MSGGDIKLVHRLFAEQARASLFAFQRVFHPMVNGESYIDTFHSEALCHAIENVVAGETRRLAIAIPPRHFKSYIASVAAPAWMLGNDPKLRIICASYGAELADGFGVQTRQIMTSPLYKSAFPKTRFTSKSPAADFLRTTHNGSRRATSVGGALTGVGADVIIIDDPMKAQDISSLVTRDSVYSWLKGAVLSRFDTPAESRLIIVQQRLHPDDLIGRVMVEEGWTVLAWPAETQTRYELHLGQGRKRLMQPGDILFPQRFPKAELDKLRLEWGEAAYNAQMLQRPTPPGGHLFSMSAFQRFDLPAKIKPQDYEAIVISIDCAIANTITADFTAITVWGILGPQVRLLDATRGRWTLHQTLNALSAYQGFIDHPKVGVLVESGGSGTPLCYDLKAKGLKRVWLWTPRKSKEARAEHADLQVQRKVVFLPNQAPWLNEFENELSDFPHGKNDDYVDSFSQVMWNLEGNLGPYLGLKSFPTKVRAAA